MDTQTISPETAAEEITTFQTGEVATIAGGHFVHDTYSAFLAPLLPMIRDRLRRHRQPGHLHANPQPA